MQNERKKIADPDGNQNQRGVRQDVQPCNTIDSSTDSQKKQGGIPVFSMMDETAEAWNAKAVRINCESAIRQLLDERWAPREVAV